MQTTEFSATEPMFQIERGDGPLVAAAIHDGHAVRPELNEWLALDDGQRLREEDRLPAHSPQLLIPKLSGCVRALKLTSIVPETKPSICCRRMPGV
jgi:hypothetical protein